jgi:HEPN domain-containing protein
MKQTTKDWLTAAEDDLLAAKKLLGEDRLTNVVAFHCQQSIEKWVL